MPYSNLPESKWGKMDRCVQKVMAQGHDKQSAIGICYNAITGKGKSLKVAAKDIAAEIAAAIKAALGS